MKKLFAVASLVLVLNFGQTICAEGQTPVHSQKMTWDDTLRTGSLGFATTACAHVAANLAADLVRTGMNTTPNEVLYNGAKLTAAAYTSYCFGSHLYSEISKDKRNLKTNLGTVALWGFLGGMSVPFNFSLRG